MPTRAATRLPQARRLLATLVAVCGNFANDCAEQLEALQGGAATPGSSAEQGQAEQRRQHAARIQAALAQLRRALQLSPCPNGMLIAVPAEALPSAICDFQQRLLPAAKRMAEAMQALWAEPWEQRRRCTSWAGWHASARAPTCAAPAWSLMAGRQQVRRTLLAA